jgi:hypothetical protein
MIERKGGWRNRFSDGKATVQVMGSLQKLLWGDV